MHCAITDNSRNGYVHWSAINDKWVPGSEAGKSTCMHVHVHVCTVKCNSNFVPRASRRVFRPVFKCEGKKKAEPFFSRAFEKRGEKLPDLTFACANCAFCAGEMNTRW
jgi:diadenosine tetraphosphate (Ap4A) HIT family hydrolase